ncbi:MAG: zinc ribbon domain-containing protein [Gemmataceae bacterium]|nr:zinc ribbon domain-containing protein [Gemmataceae bacterium]
MAYHVTCADCRLEFEALPEEEDPWLRCPGCGASVLNPVPFPVSVRWQFPWFAAVCLVGLLAGTLGCVSLPLLVLGFPPERLPDLALAGILFVAGLGLIRAGQQGTPEVVGDYLRGTALTVLGVLLLVSSLTLIGGPHPGLILGLVLGGLALLRVGHRGLTLALPRGWALAGTAALGTLLMASWLALMVAIFGGH